jgi:hypothetical protein
MGKNFDFIWFCSHPHCHWHSYFPQEEQWWDEQEPQEEPPEELPALAALPATEKAKADMSRPTWSLLHRGQVMLSELLKTSFSNSWSH